MQLLFVLLLIVFSGHAFMMTKFESIQKLQSSKESYHEGKANNITPTSQKTFVKGSYAFGSRLKKPEQSLVGQSKSTTDVKVAVNPPATSTTTIPKSNAKGVYAFGSRTKKPELGLASHSSKETSAVPPKGVVPSPVKAKEVVPIAAPVVPAATPIAVTPTPIKAKEVVPVAVVEPAATPTVVTPSSSSFYPGWTPDFMLKK
jgi:hypothetical protein